MFNEIRLNQLDFQYFKQLTHLILINNGIKMELNHLNVPNLL